MVHPRNRDKFSMDITMTIANFMKNKNNTILEGKVTFKHETIRILNGHCSLDVLLIYLNKTLNLFNVMINRIIGNKCNFHFSKKRTYYSKM